MTMLEKIRAKHPYSILKRTLEENKSCEKPKLATLLFEALLSGGWSLKYTGTGNDAIGVVTTDRGSMEKDIIEKDQHRAERELRNPQLYQ